MEKDKYTGMNMEEGGGWKATQKAITCIISAWKQNL